MCWSEVSLRDHVCVTLGCFIDTRCSLAYAELYLSLAAIVRRFHLELYETTYEDIEAVCDALMPMPRADTKGVRVLVK